MASARTLHLPTLVTAATLLAVFAVHLGSWVFVCDDAYISFRYAHNLGTAGEAAYNLAPLERVEGYSNPLWVLVLAAFEAIGVSAPAVAPVLTAAASSFCLLLSVGCLRESYLRLGHSTPHAGELFIPALWLVLTPEFVVWGSGGLEGSTALAFGLATLLNSLRGKWTWAAAMAALAVLTRPDTVMWLAPSALLSLGLVSRTDPALRPTRNQFLLAAAVLVFPVLAHLLWRHNYYGEWMPNTWAIKRSGWDLRMDFGVAYLRAWAIGSGAFVLALFTPWFRRAHAPFVAGALANLAWAWWVGGDFMAYGRFVLPATALSAIAGAGLLIEARAQFQARVQSALSGRFALLLGGALALATAWRLPARIDEDRGAAWLDERWESVDGMHRFAAVRVAAGLAMRERLPADTKLSVGAAGALPYASRLQAFDAYGLVDPGVATSPGAKVQGRARPGHQFHAGIAYMRAREPELMCHVGWVGAKRRPAPALARRRAGRGWQWFCVDTGPIEDPRAGTLPSQLYCCPATPGFEPPELPAAIGKEGR